MSGSGVDWNEVKKELRTMEKDEDGNRYLYLGSVFSLDPCGRYHNVISPNGATESCGAFWETLEAEASRHGFSIVGGEGDPTDVYVVG